MIAIAIVAALVGWQTVGRIDGTMNRIIDYEMVAEGRLNDLDATFQTITVAQRTLLNTSLPPETRIDQHEDIVREAKSLDRLSTEVTDLLKRGADQVAGWDSIRGKWEALRPALLAWNKATADGVAKLHLWEETTILSPDALLKNIMQYRGDHFQLTARLGEMISKRSDSGAEINPADNLCAFGKWRQRFDNGEEVFSRNPNLRKAMDIMTGPHREFHQSAADVQKLVRGGFAKNQEAIATRFAQHLDAARSVIDTFGMITEEAERSRQLYTDAETFTMGDLRQARAAALGQLSALMADNLKNMDNNFQIAQQNGRRGVATMQTLAIAALALGVLIIAYLYLTMRSQLTRPLTRVIASLDSDANEVAAEASGVASSSASLSDGSSSQSAALEETSAAIEEITSMARRNLENAQQANNDMKGNADQIRESTAAVERMSTAMGEIKDSSEKIGNILKTIEDIAFQTNLLALNAAVEAARAGEAGKGFAVVADEVRNLAQRSAQAVKDTAELITGTVDRVSNGVRITNEIENHFTKISETTDRITRMIDEIDVATSEQTQGLEQINQSVSQIDQVNQENARHAETNARASVNLNERSGNLMTQIDDLAGVLRTIIGSGGVPAIHAGGRSGGRPARKPMKALPVPESDMF